MTFFDEKQAAAVLKHGILRRYLRIFCSKTGYTAADRRVYYLDGYAGPGLYTDGHQGSPVLAAQTAAALSAHRELHGVYVEEKRRRAEQLRTNLADTDHSHEVVHGSLEERLDDVLSRMDENSPLFAFFDPFGLGIPLNQLANVLRRAKYVAGYRHGPATEVLLNFSYPGLRRTAGHLAAKSNDPRYLKARDAILRRLDNTLGGNWWRVIWRSEDTDRVEQIVAGYLQRVQDITSVTGWYRAPISKRWHGPTIYELMLFTYYPREGLWHFNESVSLALEEFYNYCKQSELDLFPKRGRDDALVAELKKNLILLLKNRSRVSISLESYGELVGYARETHLRKAIKQLHKEGQVIHDGKGNLAGAILEKP